jgi:hypothetical protein
MNDVDETAQPERDVLSTVSEELERAEGEGDEARLAVLESAHARLAAELDAPGPLEH